MANKRLYFACEALGFAPDGSNSYVSAHGVQSVGVTTTFNTEPVFELGQIKIYENIENIPDVEVTMEKVVDGYPLLWHLATRGSASVDLAGRSNAKTTVALSLFPDTNKSASGTPVASLNMSGLFASSHSISIPVEGNISESITLIGNNSVWKTGATSLYSGNFDNTDRPLAITYNSGGIQRRENVLFTPTVAILDANNQVNASSTSPFTVLPPDVAGISASGTNVQSSDGTQYSCSIQSINVSVNLGRDQILELGRRTPYFRFVTFPVEVTSEIETISKSGHWIGAQEVGPYTGGNNTRSATIKVALQDGTFIDLGTENRLTNITLGGGDTGGGNQTITYSFSTYNDYTIIHPQDPG
jgi:hypothetical protein